MVVAHNLQSQNANRILKISTGDITKSGEKLGSGYRINRSADDAAGLAISEKMRAQIRGLDMASKNALDGISAIQTAEGVFGDMQNMLQRVNELATQAANDTNTDSDRLQLQREISSLVNEIDDTAMRTHFNTKLILNGENSRNGYKNADGTPAQGVISFEDAGAAFNTNFQNATPIDAYGNITISTDKYSRSGDLYILAPGSLADPHTEELFANTKWEEVNLIFDDGGTTDISSFFSKVEPVDPTKGYITDAEEIGHLVDLAYGGAGAVANTKYYNSQKDMADGFIARHGKDAKRAEVINDGGDFKIKLQAFGDVNDPFNMKLQVGALSGQGINVEIDHLNARALGINGLNVLDFENAGNAMKRAQDALDKVSTSRAKLGALQNRLEHTIDNINNSSENTQAAESRIRDVNMALEMTKYTKNNILAQTGQAMLAQANQSTQGVLALLA